MRPSSVCISPKFLYSSAEAVDGQFGRIAGGHVWFSHASVIEPGAGKRELVSYGDLAASSDAELKTALARIEEPRADILSLSMSEPQIMGIVNVTPDSFSDGGEFNTVERAIAQGQVLVEQGAALLDVGGESTRPGSDPVDVDQELARVLPVVNGLNGAGVPISCDTRKARVMEAASFAGAGIIDDVSSLNYDPEARVTASRLQAPVILMHSKGEPKVMQNAPDYEDVCLEVFATLEADILLCEEAGIPRSRIIADPGIGFGKTFDHNLELLHELAMFHGLGVPLMLGASRKGFLGALTGVENAGERAVGSVSAALSGLGTGVQFFRVHDVKETAEAFAVWRGISRRAVR